MTPETPKADEPKPGSERVRFSSAEAVALLLSIAIIVAGLSSMLGLGANREDRARPKGDDDRQAEAVVFCEQQMRRRLKAPGSADFPWGATAQAVGNRIYVVNSYVDAQNSFGAELRTHYVCRAQYDGDTWRLIAFDLSG